MKHIKKNIYFKNVYLFIKKIKNLIIIKNNKMIRENL